MKILVGLALAVSFVTLLWMTARNRVGLTKPPESRRHAEATAEAARLLAALRDDLRTALRIGTLEVGIDLDLARGGATGAVALTTPVRWRDSGKRIVRTSPAGDRAFDFASLIGVGGRFEFSIRIVGPAARIRLRLDPSPGGNPIDFDETVPLDALGAAPDGGAK